MNGRKAATAQPHHRANQSIDLQTDVPLVSEADRAWLRECESRVVALVTARGCADVLPMLGLAVTS